jgi:hypothetical protein
MRDRQLAARSYALRAALIAWSRAWLAAQRPAITPTGMEGAKARRGDVDALTRILRFFGLARSRDAAGEELRGLPRGDREPALARAGELVVGGDAYVELATAIEGDMRARLSDAVGAIVTDASRRGQTVGEVTRRLRTEIRAAPAAPADDDPSAVLSWARAEAIARTETARAENTGRLAAYTATGVEELEWVAYSDGRSGDRHHERLHRERRRVGQTWRTPLGNELRFPGDPQAPPEDTVNCRCTLRPVRRGG